MEQVNILNGSTPNQGTNLYESYLTEFLSVEYFKSEPRTTLSWVRRIRHISQGLITHNEVWYDLLPANLTDEQITQYINDPRGTIESGILLPDEITELRQPHRILLFYFLKKMAGFEKENQRIIRNVNNEISREIFRMRPILARPDAGYAIVFSEDQMSVDVHKDMILEAIIESEPFTRKYEITSELFGKTMNVTQMRNAFKIGRDTLGLEEFQLPLSAGMKPFRKNETDQKFIYPSVTIQSPLLCMQEGDRHIALTLKTKDKLVPIPTNYWFSLSTPEGWVKVPNENVEVTPHGAAPGLIEFKFKIQPEFPPLAPVLCPVEDEDDEEAEVTLCSEKGGIRVFHLSQDKQIFQLSEVEISVNASGLLPYAIRNQEQVLDVKDNFQPFGLDAEPQTAFSFTHPELTHPSLELITVEPTWVGKPEEFDKYYEAYKKTENEFEVEIRTFSKTEEGAIFNSSPNQYVDKNGNASPTTNSAKLFDPTISFLPAPEVNSRIEPCLPPNEEKVDPLDYDFYIQMELTPEGFGVSEYPLLMTDYSIAQANFWALRKIFNKEATPVNMPYIPQWSQFLISYSSKLVIWKEEGPNENINIIENTPFGYTQYNGGEISMREDEFGFFSIGIEDVTSESTGSLYFNGEVGNTEAAPASVDWWYMSPIGWRNFKQYIVIDETNGLTQTGLFTWTIPTDFTNENTIMSDELFWLKATVRPEEVPNERTCVIHNGEESNKFQNYLMSVNGIFANAISIKRERKELNESQNVKQLPAGSDLSFAIAEADYTWINPFPTSGELKAESELDFWARAFNRVRNRGRMVEYQDFEDLILHHFRELVLVKCVARTSGSNRVNVVVINRQTYDSYPYSIAPLKSVKELQEIQNYAIQKTSPFFQTVIEANITNPCYREIGFLVCVVFKDESLKAENKLRLYEDLRRYINPWIFERELVPKFGCWFDYGSVLSFLQSQPYVEAVLDLKLGLVDKNTLRFSENYEFQFDEVLILSNENTIVAVDTIQDFERLGIGVMEIDKTFIVADK